MQMEKKCQFVKLCIDVIMFFSIIELQKIIENKSVCNMVRSRHLSKSALRLIIDRKIAQ